MRPLLMTALLFSLAACGSNEQTFKVKDGNGVEQSVTIDHDGDKTEFKSDDGTMTLEQGGANAHFPAYAPQFPGSKVTATMNVDNTGKDGGTGTMIAMETDATPAAVIAFYKEKLTAAGMKIGMESTSGNTAMLAASEKDDGEGGVMINANADNGKTTINIIGGKDQ